MTARVCIDGFNLSLEKGSGIATYARTLHDGLAGLGFQTQLLLGPARAPGDNPLLNEIALSDGVPVKPTRKSVGRFLSNRTSRPIREAVTVARTGEVIAPRTDIIDRAGVIWSCQDVFHTANWDYGAHGRFTELRLGPAGERARTDVTHWTCVLPIREVRTANLYTIHDVVPLRLPHATLDDKARYYAMCAEICRKADHVVTVSEQSRADIIRLFGIEEARITNTYQSVDVASALAAAGDEEVAAEVESALGLPWRGYFLYFGAVEPKKNIGRLVEAYLTSGVKTPLIMVGGRAWLEEGEMGLVESNLGAERVRRYDYLPRQLLLSLVRGARATLFPSIYEGFGLPALESMALGTPVLTSNSGALAEVAGDAALLVDPLDVRAIKRGIQALDADEAMRGALAARGLGQAEKYSAQAYQGRLAELYKRFT
jgi:glycosyltransferase involved in cell wall biosynthesis